MKEIKTEDEIIDILQESNTSGIEETAKKYRIAQSTLRRWLLLAGLTKVKPPRDWSKIKRFFNT